MRSFSNFLLNLSRGALEKPAYEFKDWALSEAKSLIPFDSCVWLMGNWIDETPVVHTAHLHRLDGNFIESWMRFQHEDKLARDVTLHSNRTFNVDVAREYENTNIYNIHCKSHGVEHIVATGRIDPDTLLLNSMCFYRSNIDQPFSEQERALKEILFQHLVEAARINWLTNLPNMFSAYQRSSFNALAACDNAGLLHVAMPSFVEICRKEWSSWKGPFLPQEILETVRENQNYIGQSIVISIFKIKELTLLRARIKVPADKLSPRELEIAQQFAAGVDYKTIAQELTISPSTVKVHLNKIYTKLGINEKASLVAKLMQMTH
jgi:DNA-binding CsgD family transcriptional regulator